MKELLIKLGACSDAIEWAGDKSWPEIYAKCDRGYWLLWLWRKLALDKKHEKLTIKAAATCALTARLWMPKESVEACEVYLVWSEGEATNQELKQAYAVAYAAYALSYAAYLNHPNSSTATAHAAATAATLLPADVTARCAANAAVFAGINDAPKQISDIVRKMMPIEMWGL
jgi:hypothetical protein